MTPAQLKSYLTSLVVDIDAQISTLTHEARVKGLITPFQLQEADGTWVLPGLLLAKAQALNGLALLENTYRPRTREKS